MWILSLQADASAIPETRLVVLTGTPLTPTAGTAPRSLAIVISTAAKLRKQAVTATCRRQLELQLTNRFPSIAASHLNFHTEG